MVLDYKTDHFPFPIIKRKHYIAILMPNRHPCKAVSISKLQGEWPTLITHQKSEVPKEEPHTIHAIAFRGLLSSLSFNGDAISIVFVDALVRTLLRSRLLKEAKTAARCGQLRRSGQQGHGVPQETNWQRRSVGQRSSSHSSAFQIPRPSSLASNDRRSSCRFLASSFLAPTFLSRSVLDSLHLSFCMCYLLVLEMDCLRVLGGFNGREN